ncbi:hypothetical protein [Rivularia sp. PCC 7116]|nr:hypothetical protein [Rivularia sp. PCC 7116]
MATFIGDGNTIEEVFTEISTIKSDFWFILNSSGFQLSPIAK